MTASEKSFLGLAKQTAKGTPNVTDASFTYLLFSEGAVAPQNSFLPLDQEIGGGAMLRNVVKVGVMSGGALSFIPRPNSLGHLLLGAFGNVGTPVDNLDGSYDHVFDLGTDQFAAPYYTVRSTPGGLWGEQFQDLRVASVSLNWRAANFLRGQVGFMGGLPAPNVSTGSWSPLTYLDTGPQFLAPVTTVELPAASAVKVLSGSFTAAMQIPMEEQWITGSYNPDDFQINQRQFVLTLALKVEDATLYTKMNYDGTNGAATAWAVDMFREANITMLFNSDQDAGSTPTPYSLQIAANGQSGANANIAWSVQPIALRAGRQVTMVATGTFLANPVAGQPLTVTLTNTKSTQY